MVGNDPDFRQSEKDWFSFVEKLTEKLVEIDETIPELPVKDIVRQDMHAIGLAETYHVACRYSESIAISASAKIPHHIR